MTLNFLVAPDFPPEHFAGWHMLNTVMQRRSGLHLHLLTPADATEQAQLLAGSRVDVLYANPFDAATLIRENGYLPLARPVAHADEMVIACAADSPVTKLEELKPGSRVALTPNRDVKLIGLRLLEAADLGEADVQWQQTENHQATARACIRREVDAGFFLASAYASLSRLTRSQLRTLVESAISDISHVVLLHPDNKVHSEAIGNALLGIGREANDQAVLDALGIAKGFEPMSREQAEFMIDLMETLRD